VPSFNNPRLSKGRQFAEAGGFFALQGAGGDVGRARRPARTVDGNGGGHGGPPVPGEGGLEG